MAGYVVLKIKRKFGGEFVEFVDSLVDMSHHHYINIDTVYTILRCG